MRPHCLCALPVQLSLIFTALSRSQGLTALFIYFLISTLIFGLPIISSPGHIHVGHLYDPAQMIWCMEWWPYALLHRMNPFITHAVWAPDGFNLTWSASVPALSMLFSPITLFFGPLASYNLAAIAGPAFSGWAGFLLCRYITGSFGSAFAGGLLYAFSPYEVGHVLAGHLNLTYVAIPPICVLLVLLLIDGTAKCRTIATALTLVIVIQCLISTEILATMTFFGAIAILAATATLPPYRRRLLRAAILAGGAYLAAAIILSPFLYYVLLKGDIPSVAIFPARRFSADLLSFVVPDQLTLIQTRKTAALASWLAQGIIFHEKSAYLGIPLLEIGCLYLWPRRNEPVPRLLTLLFLITVVFCLGPTLHVDGNALVVFPGKVLEMLPLIKHALPIRFTNYVFLIFAIVVSLWVAGPKVRLKNALAVVTLISLIPNLALLVQQYIYDTPLFFGHRLYLNYLHRNDNILVIPYGMRGPSMVWQAETAMYFRMPGGYLGFIPNEFRRWPIVNTLLTSLPIPDTAGQLRTFVDAHKIDAIVVTESAAGLVRQLPATLGLKPQKIGGVWLYRFPKVFRDNPPAISLDNLQRAAAQSWFSMLLCAGFRYATATGSLDGLDPARAHAMGFLPDSEWSTDLDLLQAGLAHEIFNGLWIGPGPGATITVGIATPSSAISQLMSTYGKQATAILYPYPEPYRHDSQSASVDLLVMNLPVGALSTACPLQPKSERTREFRDQRRL